MLKGSQFQIAWYVFKTCADDYYFFRSTVHVIQEQKSICKEYKLKNNKQINTCKQYIISKINKLHVVVIVLAMINTQQIYLLGY